MKKPLLIIIGLLALAYIVGGPYLTVYLMAQAAEAKDGEALSEHIDYPSVRQSMKDQLNAHMAKEIARDQEMKDNPFAALGAALAGAMVDKMVDVYVTPASITQLMHGEKPEPTQGPADSPSEPAPSPDAPAPQEEKEPFEGASMSYDNKDKFSVRVPMEKDQEVRFILRRQGWTTWKLTEIIFPLDKV